MVSNSLEFTSITEVFILALFTCQCGKQISDRAEACPYCGRSIVSAEARTSSTGYGNPVQPAAPVRQAAANGFQKLIIIIAAVIAAALIALITIVLSKGEEENTSQTVNNTVSVASDVYTPEVPVINNYNVTLSVDCRKNITANQYDVDILVDGQFLTTLKHGASEDYALTLSEGSHKLEFRINGKH